MYGFVLRDIRTRKFVAYPGLASSFTTDILKARKFPTREDADRERCPLSEVVVPLSDLFGD